MYGQGWFRGSPAGRQSPLSRPRPTWQRQDRRDCRDADGQGAARPSRVLAMAAMAKTSWQYHQMAWRGGTMKGNLLKPVLQRKRFIGLVGLAGCALCSLILGAETNPVSITVLPGKVCYAPKEEVVVKVILKANIAGAKPGELVLTESWGLDESRVVAKKEMVLSPDTAQEHSFSFNLTPAEYGHELKAEYLVGGETRGRGAEYFSVASKANFIRMSFLGPYTPLLITGGDMPDSWSDMAPAVDDYCNNWNYGDSITKGPKQRLLQRAKRLHARGFKVMC